MKTIRESVFETNSSSMHSLTMRLPKDRKRQRSFNEDGSFEQFDEEGYVIVEMGLYGWGNGDRDDTLRSQYDKLCYLLTLVMECEMREDTWPRPHYYKSDAISPSTLLKQTEGFETLNNWLISNSPEEWTCKGINPNYEWKGLNFTEACDKTSEYKYYMQSDYFIDHQSSTDEYENLEDFLSYYKVTLDDVILNPNIAIIMDNDNH